MSDREKSEVRSQRSEVGECVRGGRGIPILTAVRRYMTGGLFSAGADLSTFALLAKLLGVHPLLANIGSRSIGGLVSFLVNKHWTFENRGQSGTHVQFVRFWCVFGVSFALSEGFVGLFHSVLGWEAMISKVCAEGIAAIFNFMSHRHFTFR